GSGPEIEPVGVATQLHQIGLAHDPRALLAGMVHHRGVESRTLRITGDGSATDRGGRTDDVDAVLHRHTRPVAVGIQPNQPRGIPGHMDILPHSGPRAIMDLLIDLRRDRPARPPGEAENRPTARLEAHRPTCVRWSTRPRPVRSDPAGMAPPGARSDRDEPATDPAVAATATNRRRGSRRRRCAARPTPALPRARRTPASRCRNAGGSPARPPRRTGPSAVAPPRPATHGARHALPCTARRGSRAAGRPSAPGSPPPLRHPKQPGGQPATETRRDLRARGPVRTGPHARALR